jgi:glycosyltransferase involved in cell wall biosynthesis
LKTLLVSPELFRAEGGIARIMRVYLKALCELASPPDTVDSLVLNDHRGTDPRLSRYSGPALKSNAGFDRRRLGFAWHVVQLARKADRAICGHLHLLPLLRFAQQLNSRLAYSLVAHGIEVWRPYSARERRALLGAHRILCVSEYTRRQLLRFCPALDPSRLRVVPNALDPFFQAGSPVPAPTSAAGPRLLTVARLAAADAYKGVDTLIEALPLLRPQFPDVRLRVVGSGDDLPRLQALAGAKGVADSVEFAGTVTDESLKNEYATCNVFALPSRREGFGLVYLEAMSFGKPCLGARAGGAPEVVNDGVGALADYGNIPDIAAAVTDLVRHPRDPETIRRHAETFGFSTFKRQLAAALA